MGFKFPYRVKLLGKKYLNHNVVQFRIEKPYGYTHSPGQALELSIAKPGYELAVAPFTISNLNTDGYLELTIKIHPHKKSLTYGMATLESGDFLQITDPWDSYNYKGPGMFIAAGTGITPFLPILESLEAQGDRVDEQHSLLYANKTPEDILYPNKLQQRLGKKCVHVLSRSRTRNTLFGRIHYGLLESLIHDVQQYFYVCGPKLFEKDISKSLLAMGVGKRYIQTGNKF
ncbi:MULTISPECIES: ferredoxin reductase domain-containing protein [Arenibacter]|uniref:hypothetical protein n=1 Tax=Arenibacter TaxID=178469 RepID=UPI000A3900D7|nr:MULTISPECIES: hypothetical protein [Arenibacter]